MIKNITLKSFRRFSSFNLETNHNLIILCGQNAIGKTTILEAIYACSTGSSHKTKEIKDLIKYNDPYAKIHLNTTTNTFDVVISQKGRKMMINNNPILKLSDFIGRLQAIIFSPQDINLINGDKGLRRSFFDLEISLRSKKYLSMVQNFRIILRKRNELLKANCEDNALLDAITAEMNLRQEKIMIYRRKFIASLNEELNKLRNSLGYDELVSILYKPSLNESIVDLNKFYNNNLTQDRLNKITNYGIHRDNYIFYLNGYEASKYASQGQQRSIALLLKIALCNLTLRTTGCKPILLLDDVFSELDDVRCRSLIAFLSGENQTFITTTTVENIPTYLKERAYIINLKEWIKWQI